MTIGQLWLHFNFRRMLESEVLDIFGQMVSAIRYMHNKNVLHRDLKTANIFLTKEEVVKVGDFGISKMLTTKAGGAHTVLGTPYYIRSVSYTLETAYEVAAYKIKSLIK